MKRYGWVWILAWFLIATNSFAGQRYNSNTGTRDYCVTIENETGDVLNDQCLPLKVSDGFLTAGDGFFLLRSAGGTSGATSLTTSQANLVSGYSVVRKALTSDSRYSTGILPNGHKGETLTIIITEAQTGSSWTITPVTKTGFTSLIFEGVGDIMTLLYVNDTVGWIPVTSTSVQILPFQTQ